MPESSREEIAKLEALYANNPEGRVFTHLAEALRKAGELDRARSILEDGIAKHPTYASAHVVLGRVQAGLNQTDEAAESFRRVLSLDPHNLIALRSLGDIARHAGRNEEAIGYFEQLKHHDPTNTEIDEIITQLSAPPEPAAEPPAAPAEVQAPEPDFEHERAFEEEPVAAAEAPQEVSQDIDLDWVPDIDGAFEGLPGDLGSLTGETAPALDAQPEAEEAPIFDLPDGVGDLALDAAMEEADTGFELPGFDDVPAAEDAPLDISFEAEPPVEAAFEPEATLEAAFGAPEPQATPEFVLPDTAFGDVSPEAEPEPESEAESEPEPLPTFESAFDQPAVEEPAFDPQAAEAPAFEEPSFEERSFEAASFEEPSFEEPSLEEPAFDAPFEAEPLAEQDEEPAGEVVTETIAELYTSQGLHDRAADVYRALLQQRPGDAALEARLREAEASAAAPAAAPAAEPPPEEATAWEEAFSSEPDAEGWIAAGAGATASAPTPYAWEEDGEADTDTGAPVTDYFRKLLSWKPSAPAPGAAPSEPVEAAPAADRTDQEDALLLLEDLAPPPEEPVAPPLETPVAQPIEEPAAAPVEEPPAVPPLTAATVIEPEPLPWEEPAAPAAPPPEPPPMTSTATTPEAAFDEWFGAPEEPAAQPPAATTQPSEGASPSEGEGGGEDDDDLEMFRSWLQSLKK